MLQLNSKENIYYSLRFASAMCFIGHGSFGIITKAIWCNYFGVFGIGHNTAYAMMPYVGVLDICMGLILLFYPLRAVAGWLVIWGLFTAFLRPLSGEPVAEFIERAGNFGAPLALLLFTANGSKNLKQWLKPVHAPLKVDQKIMTRVTWCLRIIVFLLFLGHGWLNIIEKQSLIDQYKTLGFSNAANTAHIIGSLEILAAFSILIRPVRGLVIMLFIWKIFSELFYPHYEIFEFIERGGSYGAILALWFLLKQKSYAISFSKASVL